MTNAAAMTSGTRIKFTGKFLKNTGQQLGGEGQSIWTVVECDCGLCKTGDFVATNEKNYDDSGQRHIAKGNVYVYGTLDSRNSP